MKDEMNGTVVKDEYSGWSGWVTEYYVEPLEGSNYFDDIIEKYEGKKVKIIIQEIE